MSLDLAGEMVLRQATWCVVREQEEQVLIYNTRTDELHLVPPTGFFVYQQFDGTRTLVEVEALLRQFLGREMKESPGRLGVFVEQLLERGVLEVDRAQTG